MTEHVVIAQSGAVLELRLNRPEKKNALSNAMYGALADALSAAERDESVRAVVISAVGDDFTAGNDLADFAAVATGALQLGERHVGRFLKALAQASKPYVAAVQGQAIGIGTTMLLHCDLVYVSPDARLSTPFVNLGLVPEAASSLLLPARIGYARAFAMFALGETVQGEDIVRLGLANGVVASAGLRDAALSAAGVLAQKAPGALRAAKRLMRDAAALGGIMDRENDVFTERLRSTEAHEAFLAFREKRAPQFG